MYSLRSLFSYLPAIYSISIFLNSSPKRSSLSSDPSSNKVKALLTSMCLIQNSGTYAHIGPLYWALFETKVQVNLPRSLWSSSKKDSGLSSPLNIGSANHPCPKYIPPSSAYSSWFSSKWIAFGRFRTLFVNWTPPKSAQSQRLS